MILHDQRQDLRDALRLQAASRQALQTADRCEQLGLTVAARQYRDAAEAVRRLADEVLPL